MRKYFRHIIRQSNIPGGSFQKIMASLYWSGFSVIEDCSLTVLSPQHGTRSETKKQERLSYFSDIKHTLKTLRA